MNLETCGTLFSGFGGSDCGFKAAGLKPVVAVEYDEKLASVYRKNHGDHVTVADVREVDFSQLTGPDLLGLSPVCTRASVANSGGEESELDIECAKACVRAVETWKPQAVMVENVYGYRHFEAFKLICAALERLGYGFDYWHLNAANYGVPQTRQRLILIARRDGRRPSYPEPAHAKFPVASLFGTLQKWVGWYEAIEDLIPELPDSQFAVWQLARMGGAMPLGETFLHMTGGSSQHPETGGTGIKTLATPAGTVATNSDRMARAFIVEGSAAGVDNKFNLPLRMEDEPVFTQRATQNSPRASLRNGRQVSMTPRALARFQSFPDSFQLSGHRKTDCIGIGNAVPPLLAEAVARSLMK